MKRNLKTAIGAITALGIALAAAAAIAHPGGMAGDTHTGGMGGMGGMMQDRGTGMHGSMHGGMQHDEASATDMGQVHQLLENHDQIRRTVTHLPNGIRTVTESDDPKVAQTIQAHVASMVARLADGREFNMFSTTVPVLFENRKKIATQVENTAKGSIVTQTSADGAVVTALQGHAKEVSELARDGVAAMQRSAMSAMPQRARAMGRH